jgi:hypothetical protein
MNWKICESSSGLIFGVILTSAWTLQSGEVASQPKTKSGISQIQGNLHAFTMSSFCSDQRLAEM